MRNRTSWTATIVVVAFSAALGGCATPVDEATIAVAKKPLLCKDKAQCDLYWSRAQAWVASSSDYRIQNVTDTLITTYGPTGPLWRTAYQIVRVANVDGSARITIEPLCSMYGCRPDANVASAAFKRYVVNGA